MCLSMWRPSFIVVFFVFAFPLISFSAFDPQKIMVDSDFAGASAVVLADFNNDGFNDIAGAAYYEGPGDIGTFSWWQNYHDFGEGLWGEQIDIAQIFGAYTLRAADLDQDGDIDLLGTSTPGDSVWWFENEFIPSGEVVFVPRSILELGPGVHPFDEPTSIDVGDFDQDGTQDVVIAFMHSTNPLNPHLVILPNEDGTGEFVGANWQFNPNVILLSTPAGSGFNGLSWVRAVDFNQDGLTDIVVGSAWNWITGTNFAWYRNDGKKNFTFIPIGGGDPEEGGLWGSFSADVADMNNDGRLDLITHQGDVSPIKKLVMFQSESSDQTEWSKVVLDQNASGSTGETSILAVDLDQDGLLDIVSSAHFLESRVTIWRNECGSFRRYEVDDFNGHGIAVGDLNADQKPEIVSGSWNFYSGEVVYWSNFDFDEACVGDLNADGYVGSADLAELLSSWGSTCSDEACCRGDLNGDQVVNGIDLGVLLQAWGPCL